MRHSYRVPGRHDDGVLLLDSGLYGRYTRVGLDVFGDERDPPSVFMDDDQLRGLMLAIEARLDPDSHAAGRIRERTDLAGVKTLD